MLNRKNVMLLTLSLAGCGQALERNASQPLAAAAGTRVLHGVDDQGASCVLTLTQDAGDQLLALSLKGTFVVDYKIPTPGSGIYGKNRWDGTFDSTVNAAEKFSQSSGWFGGHKVYGRGKPLFWDVPTVDHYVTLSPSLAQPTSASYHSEQKVAVVIPFVVTDLQCKNLQ